MLLVEVYLWLEPSLDVHYIYIYISHDHSGLNFSKSTTMIHCMTTIQMNDSGRHGHKQNFAKSHFKLKAWAKFATERLHTMSAHVMFFLRYLLMLSLKVIVLLVGVFPTSKNKAMPVGIVPQVKVNCCFFPITPYPNLQYCKMQSSPTCRIHLHALLFFLSNIKVFSLK